MLCQQLAFLEIVNSVLGLVKGSVLASFMQVTLTALPGEEIRVILFGLVSCRWLVEPLSSFSA